MILYVTNYFDFLFYREYICVFVLALATFREKKNQ